MSDPALKEPMAYADLDMYAMTRELDRTKSELFSVPYAAFYGPLLCSMNFYWTADRSTAATDGVSLMWNPYWFLHLPKLTRLTVLMHELRHPAKLHFIRQGDRDHEIWNYACDIKINNELMRAGYSFVGLEWCWYDLSFPEEMPEEDIYDVIFQRGSQLPSGGSWGPTNASMFPGGIMPPMPKLLGDMFPSGGPMSKEDMARAVNNVVKAAQQAKLNNPNKAGQMPGDIEAILTQFLTPIVPWEIYLHRFMSELAEHGQTWKKPNRRYQDFYLPSRFEEEGALAHLAYFEDTSGSITDALRFNSEFKFVKETYQPKKMTLIQFDTIIQDEHVYLEEDPFDQVVIKGRGGTLLEPVRQWIIDNRPTAVVVFSDLCCAPMGPLPFDIPIIWIAISNKTAVVPYGQIHHIR